MAGEGSCGQLCAIRPPEEGSCVRSGWQGRAVVDDQEAEVQLGVNQAGRGVIRSQQSQIKEGGGRLRDTPSVHEFRTLGL